MKAVPEPNGSVLMKSFCGGVQGGGFLEKSPPGRRKKNYFI
jgi:hypothetical protein